MSQTQGCVGDAPDWPLLSLDALRWGTIFLGSLGDSGSGISLSLEFERTWLENVPSAERSTWSDESTIC
jgi:hypothetical protein